MKRLCPRQLGSLVQVNARRLLLLLGLALLILSAAINSGKLDLELSSWIQRTTRVENELQTLELAIGEGAGSNSLLILQTTKQWPAYNKPSSQLNEEKFNRRNKLFHVQNNIINDNNNIPKDDYHQNGHKNNSNVLSVNSLIIHLEALAIATRVTVDLFDVSWSLKDICLAPTPPDYEGLLVNQMLDHLMPCVIKTPLDCFWEGAKLLGPEQDVRLSSIGPKLKWTTLDPILMIEMQQRSHPHASFPYQTLLSWMRRVGIVNGYLDRPCLDPSDPACPGTAPNKFSGEIPDVARRLSGGCHGLATKQMHWKEDEIVGGITKNSSGYIIDAKALQSTVLLMGERDVYDYWRKTSKVQDINNWSTDKAKLVLDQWQKRYKEELAQYTRSSMNTNRFDIHALTPKSMLEPIDSETILDLMNFKYISILMTVIFCLAFPTFKKSNDNDEQTNDIKSTNSTTDATSISRFKTLTLALCISTIVIVTFIASLGLSSFMNLPFNMATTQILPPIALFYGFRQALLIASTYSKYYQLSSSFDECLVTECLMELMPIIVMECATVIIPLTVATAFPIQATRVFTLQAITYVLLSSLMSALFIPSLLTIFLTDEKQDHLDRTEVVYKSDKEKKQSRSISPGVISIISRKSNKSTNKVGPSVDEQIFSRLQDDLRNIKNDPRQATDFDFSARFGPNGIKTSFSLRTASGPIAHHSHQIYPQSTTFDEPKTPEPSLGLPDLVLRPDALAADIKPFEEPAVDDKLKSGLDMDDTSVNDRVVDNEGKLYKLITFIIGNEILLLSVVIIKIALFVFILTQAPKVKFGLQLRDVMLRGSKDYDSFMIREKYFPVYNIFMVTKNGLDFPSKQSIMYEFYERISNVEGVLKTDEQGVERKFWLLLFRDWLYELQESFDQERNRSAITKDGWSDDVSDSAKLAYKLLAQTGKIDNPIDKESIETNRLVDKNGIINQRAFYYYLTAWVMNDAFTYSSSEANFRPEPKIWYDNPKDLRIERARPLTYSQIPFILKLAEDQDSMKTILEIREISQRFEHINLPNFPTGIPFIFWDQFINLDYLFYTAVLMINVVLFLLISLAFGNFIVAAILILPTLATISEIYCILGYLTVPFNSIMGVMIITVVGMTTSQLIQLMICYEFKDGELTQRVSESISQSSRTVITSLLLMSSAAFVFHGSKIDFMTKYSNILIYIILTSAFNSLILTPNLLAIFGSDQTINTQQPIGRSPSRSPIRSPKLIIKNIREKNKKMRKQSDKKRGYPRVQSEISLSTISEEPQAEAQAHDLKLNFSISC